MSMVLTERRGSVTILTLNNPAQYNALAGSLLSELSRALDVAIADSAVRAILLTGAGKGFCAGAQLGGGNTFEAGEQIGDHMRASINPVIEKMRGSPTPIVVAVNGPAAGAGVGIALAGDIVIAARSARFILSFVRLGAALDAGTSLLLQRSIGVARARALALLGQPLACRKGRAVGSDLENGGRCGSPERGACDRASARRRSAGQHGADQEPDRRGMECIAGSRRSTTRPRHNRAPSARRICAKAPPPLSRNVRPALPADKALAGGGFLMGHRARNAGFRFSMNAVRPSI